jgi:hypothetical protein
VVITSRKSKEDRQYKGQKRQGTNNDIQNTTPKTKEREERTTLKTGGAFRPLVEGDTAYDTDFAMFYTLYHIFKQESIQGRGTIKGRGMIKGIIHKYIDD